MTKDIKMVQCLLSLNGTIYLQAEIQTFTLRFKLTETYAEVQHILIFEY